MYDPQTREELAHSILTALAEMDAHDQAIKRALHRIEEAGMYDAIPTESWQTRTRPEHSRRNGNDTEYLYMMFTQDHRGRYQGPHGKRKVYVGCKQDRIAEARRLAQNRVEYDRLTQALTRLTHYINRLDVTLARLKTDTEHFSPTDLGKWGDGCLL